MAVGEVIDWTIIENLLKQGNESALSLALLEYDKLIKQLFSRRGIPGLTLAHKIENAKMILSDIPSLEKARSLRERILDELDFVPARPELELAINAYHQAVVDLASSRADLSLFRRTVQLVRFYVFSKKGSAYKKVGVAFLSLFAFIYFLGGTPPGVALTGGIVTSVNTVFSWLVFLILMILVGAFLAALTIVYFDKRRRMQIIKEE